MLPVIAVSGIRSLTGKTDGVARVMRCVVTSVSTGKANADHHAKARSHANETGKHTLPDRNMPMYNLVVSS